MDINMSQQIKESTVKYASNRLRNDANIVMLAVQNNGRALEFAQSASNMILLSSKSQDAKLLTQPSLID